MQLFIYISLALFAISSAKQLQNGPQISREKPAFFEPSQNVNKQFMSPEFNLFATPEEVKALEAIESSENLASIAALKQNPGISQDSFNALIQKFYAENLKPAPIEEPQAEQVPSDLFLPKGQPVYNKQNFNKNTYRQLLLDQTKLSGQTKILRQNSYNQFAREDNLEPAKENEEQLLEKQPNQQWIRLLNYNRNPPKVISLVPERQQNYRGYGDQRVSALFKPALGANINEDLKKSVDEEIEYILKNTEIYRNKQTNSLNQVRSSHGMEFRIKSEVDKEIENVLRQHQAFEFENPNSIQMAKQSLSAENENVKSEVEKPLEFILRNGKVYRLRSNTPAGFHYQDVQKRPVEKSESEIQKGVHFLRNQQNSQFPRSYIPGVIHQGPADRNRNQGKSEKDKQIENIFRQQAYGNEKSKLFGDANNSSPSGQNENQESSEVEKQIEFILRNQQAQVERDNAKEMKNESPSVINKGENQSEVEKIHNILKKHQDLVIQRSKAAAKAISQSPPIIVHKHVSIIKHLPVPLVNKVQVSVPAPVLVPISQQYKVKYPM